MTMCYITGSSPVDKLYYSTKQHIAVTVPMTWLSAQSSSREKYLTWPAWEISKKRRRSWVWLISHTGGLVCPELPGSGLNRVTRRSESGRWTGTGYCACLYTKCCLFSSVFICQGGLILLLTGKIHSSVGVSIQISCQWIDQTACIIYSICALRLKGLVFTFLTKFYSICFFRF